MENNDEQNQGQAPAAQPTTAPILDVQPPKQDDIATPPPEQETPAQPTPSETPQPTTPSIESTPSPTSEASANPAAPDPVKQPELMAPKKHGAPVLVIVIALVVAAVLAVFTVLAFTQQDKNAAKKQPANGTAQQSPQAVTPGTVEETSDEVDAAINELDDLADFPEDELSNTSLGL